MKRSEFVLAVVAVIVTFATACFASTGIVYSYASSGTVPVVMDESGMIVSGNGTGTYVEEFRSPGRTGSVVATQKAGVLVEVMGLLGTLADSPVLVGVTVFVFILAGVCITISRRNV